MLFSSISALRQHLGDQPVTVIIGSGAVGLYSASELVKRGMRVVVVEAGETKLGGFPADSFTSIGARHDGIANGRSRTLGGTTNLWGGQLVEFQPIDFEGRDWMPGSRWPVSYEEIARHYAATYENLGIGRPAQNDDDVWRAVSGQRPDIGDDLEVFLTRWLKVPNFATYYAKAIATNPSLLVLTGHTVVGFEGSGETLTAVKVADRYGGRETMAGRYFVLAAGTIESVRLLLHSAADESWACPWRYNRNVGAYFSDHIGGRIGHLVPHESKTFFDTFCSIVWDGMKFAPKVRFRNSVLTRERRLNIQGFFAFESSISENMVYLKQFVKAAIYSRKVSGVGEFFHNLVACGRYLVPLMWRYVMEHRIFVPSTSKISFFVQAEQVPFRESRILIDPASRDENGLPTVILNWKVADDQIAAIREFGLATNTALQKAGLARLEMMDGLAASNPGFLAELRDTIHQSGGAIMGASEHDGVVDRNLRVFGTQNLFVGGSATFRTISNANTTFTALAFATRLADHLVSVQREANKI